jgi:hypothetical protein
MGAAVGCSRGAAQSTGSTGGSVVSRSFDYPRTVTFYGGPLLSLPDIGTFAWLCTGPTGSTRRFHTRYTAATNEHVAVVEIAGRSCAISPTSRARLSRPPPSEPGRKPGASDSAAKTGRPA